MKAIPQDAPIRIDDIDSPYSSIPSLRALIYGRGLDPAPAKAAAKAAGAGEQR